MKSTCTILFGLLFCSFTVWAQNDKIQKTEGYGCGEDRYNFDQTGLIKVKINPLEGDHCIEADEIDLFDYEILNGFSSDDREFASGITAKSIEYFNLFKSLVNIQGQSKPCRF